MNNMERRSVVGVDLGIGIFRMLRVWVHPDLQLVARGATATILVDRVFLLCITGYRVTVNFYPPRH